MPWPNRKAILVPIDFSEESFRALDEAVPMVESPADVHAIHVLPSLESEADFLRAALDTGTRDADAVAAMRERVDRVSPEIGVVIRTGVAGDVIAAVAEELGCDLIVMPSHGRSGLSRAFLGSVTERVLRRATCPVLVIRTR